jgi:hypothetical protein
MNNKRAWYGRPNPPPLNWDSPDKPAIRQVSAVEPPAEDLLREHHISLTNENWIALLKCLAVYEMTDSYPGVKLWRQRIRESILSHVRVKSQPQKQVRVQLRHADLDEIIRQVRIVCADRDAAWESWAEQIAGRLSV